MKIFLTLLTIIILGGCTRMAMLIEDVRQPKMEDYSSLTKFLLKLDIDTSDLLCYSDTSALYKFYKTDIGLPESRFFNRHGQLVDYRDSPQDCNGHVSVFLEKAAQIDQKAPVPNEFIQPYISDLIYVKDNRKFILDNRAYDMYLVIYWARYLGKVNKHKVFEWLNLVRSAEEKGLKVKVIKINADFQKGWGLSRDALPKFEITN